MKISVTITVLLLFLAVLGAYLYLVPQPPQRPSDIPAAGKARLLDLSGDDEVTEISIENPRPGRTIRLALRDKVWYMEEPFRNAADPVVIDGLLAALRLSPKEGEAKPEKGWEEYGLTSPNLKVGVKTRREPEMKYLLLGEKSPVADKLFARWDDGATYFLLDQRIRDVFTSTVYSFREKKVFRTPLKDITKLRFQSGLDAYEIVQGMNGWVWMDPVAFLGTDVAPETAERMLALVQNTYIKDFEAKPVDLASAGLDGNETGVQIKVWKNTEQPPEVLLIGKEAPEKDSYLAKRSDDGAVFTVARSHIVNLFDLLSSEAKKAEAASAPAQPAGEAPSADAPAPASS